MISKKDAIAEALAAGGSLDEINRQAANYARQVGTVPFRNMIVALNLVPRLNDVDDWTRLAAALTARGLARKR
jgi:hypothetical protein